MRAGILCVYLDTAGLGKIPGILGLSQPWRVIRNALGHLLVSWQGRNPLLPEPINLFGSVVRNLVSELDRITHNFLSWFGPAHDDALKERAQRGCVRGCRTREGWNGTHTS